MSDGSAPATPTPEATDAAPDTALTVALSELHPDDLEAVAALERRSFSSPWSARSLREELSRSWARFLVLHVVDPATQARRLGGYLLYWLVHDEAHILTVATEPDLRGRGLGTVLLDEIVRDARARGVRQVHLEVRRSNESAIRLYRTFGFEQIGVRPKYYQDNREDAVVMMLDLDIVKSTPAPRGVVVVR